MNTFFTRTFSGAVYAAIIIGSILSGPVVFGLVMLAVMVLGLGEFSKLLSRIGPVPPLWLMIIAALVVYVTGYLVSLSILPVAVLWGALLAVAAAVAIQLFQKGGDAFHKSGLLLFGVAYLAIPLLLTNLVQYRDFAFGASSNHILFGLFLITWFNDTFAYLTGSLFGRHKLAARISPKKTWEGSIGGFLFSMAGAYFLSLVFGQLNLSQWLVVAGIVVVFGTLGDLFESALKRAANIKESGHIMPGHGGVLDRMDSILMATPFVFIYLYFFLN